MPPSKNLTTLAEELVRIADIPKCQGCSCFLEVLEQFQNASAGDTSLPSALTQQAAALIENFQVSHGCIGCDPCYPVPIANVLAQVNEGNAPQTACCSSPMPSTETDVWPPEAGEYLVGSRLAPVAISTLASTTLRSAIADKLGTDNFAIIGITETENIGIEKVVKNIISNASIRFLILCGQESHGHLSGQTLLALHANNLDQKRKVIGSPAPRPFLKNLRPQEVQTFQRQVTLLLLIGNEDPAAIAEEARRCALLSPGPFRAAAHPVSVPRLLASRPGKFSPDKFGFFIILLDRQAGKVLLEHYRNDGTRTLVLEGNNAVSLYSSAIERRLLSRLDHAAYLGKELARAETALRLRLDYEQDSALGKDGD